MRKEASGKGKDSASKVAKPAVLSAEAAAMEQKLVELRKAMEKERAKREALMANTSGGSIWRNGGTSSGLRSGVKGKGPGEGSPLNAAGASGASSSRRPASVEAQAGQGAAPSGSAAAAGRASSARSAGAAAADIDVPSVAGSRLATSGRPANAADPKGSAGGGLAGGRGAAASSSGSGGGGAVGGMSCGTDDNSSLAEGAFNEADSHKSFLDALNEWRRANRGDAEGADAGAAASTSSDAAQQQRPRSAAMRPVESASLEVQTESRPASRPSSAKPLSYFDKLVINASSRVAGHLASGEPLESLRSSLSGQASGLPLPRPPSIAARPASASGPGATAAPSATAAKPAATASTSATATATATTDRGSSCSAPSGSTSTVPGPASGGASSSDPLSILDRLEALERQRQAADAGHGDDDDEEEGPGGAARIQVTTATGVVLTKGARLPDEVLLPHNEGC